MRTNTLASLIAVAAAAHVAIAQTDTTFTYQGELNKLGAPVNGACDFRFQLYDAMSGGSAVTSRVTVSDVSVTDGRFNVDLDFGAEVFDGAERWLSVDVRQPAGRRHILDTDATPADHTIALLNPDTRHLC